MVSLDEVGPFALPNPQDVDESCVRTFLQHVSSQHSTMENSHDPWTTETSHIARMRNRIFTLLAVRHAL